MPKILEISRRRSHEISPSRTFTRLFTLPCKRQDQASELAKVQSVLYEDAVPLKRVIMVLRYPVQRSVE